MDIPVDGPQEPIWTFGDSYRRFTWLVWTKYCGKLNPPYTVSVTERIEKIEPMQRGRDLWLEKLSDENRLVSKQGRRGIFSIALMAKTKSRIFQA